MASFGIHFLENNKKDAKQSGFGTNSNKQDPKNWKRTVVSWFLAVFPNENRGIFICNICGMSITLQFLRELEILKENLTINYQYSFERDVFNTFL